MKRITLFSLIVCLSFTCALFSQNKGKNKPSDWKLSVQSYTFHLFTVKESLEKTAQLGVRYIEIYPGQKLGGGFENEVFGYNLNPDTQLTIKKWAKSNKVKIISSGVWVANSDEWEPIFSFAKNMGMEYISAEPAHEDWDLVESLAKKYNIKVAVHNHPSESSYWKPEILLNDIQHRSALLGACCDVGHYKRMGIDPVSSLKELQGRIISLHFKDIAPQGDNGTLEDVVWGQGILNVQAMMEELCRQNFKGYFTIEYEADWENNVPKIKESIDYFNLVRNQLTTSKISK